MILHFPLIPPPPYPTTQPLFHPLFFSSFFAWRLALNVHHSAKNKRSELIGLSAAALVDPLIRPEKRRYTSEFCFNSSFWVLQSLHATVTSKVSPLPPPPNTVLGLGPVAMKTSAPPCFFSPLKRKRDCVREMCCCGSHAADGVRAGWTQARLMWQTSPTRDPTRDLQMPNPVDLAQKMNLEPRLQKTTAEKKLFTDNKMRRRATAGPALFTPLCFSQALP